MSELVPEWPEEPVLFPRTGPTLDRARSYRQALHRAIAAPDNTHVVREVRTGYITDLVGQRSPERLSADYTRDFLEDTIAEAEAEYSWLGREFGIAVPDHAFRIIRDNNNRLRTLARIGIVNGLDFDRQYASRTVNTLTHLRVVQGFQTRPPARVTDELRYNIGRYLAAAGNDGLADIGPNKLDDYKYGNPREDTESGIVSPATYLVDLEPLIHKDRAG